MEHTLVRYILEMEAGVKKSIAELSKSELRKVCDQLRPMANNGFRKVILRAIEERISGKS